MNAVTMGTLAERGALTIGDGYRTKRDELAGAGFRILRVADVLDGRVEAGGPDFVAESFRPQIGAKAAQAGDVLVTTKGTVGRVAMMPALAEEVVYSPQLCFFRVTDRDVVDPRFLSYWFASEAFREQASHRANNTDMAAYINLADIRSLEISLPAVETQRAIAEVLGALDDKIAANAQLARSALKLADSLFDREMEQATTVRLGDVSRIVLGGTPSKARMDFWNNGTVPWLASGKANEDRILRPTSLITAEALAQSAAKLMPRGSTVVAITGATLGQISRLELEACGNQSLVGIWGASTWDSDWLYFAIRSERAQLLRGATGAAQQHVNKADVENLQIPWVDEPARRDWGAVASTLLERARQADVESHSLIELRDTLLPPLMSGRLRVEDVERIVEGEV